MILGRRFPRYAAAAAIAVAFFCVGDAMAATSAAPPRLRLNGIVIYGKLKRAFVDGAWVSEGETVRAWTVIAINNLEISLENSGQSASLHLDYGIDDAEPGAASVRQHPPPPAEKPTTPAAVKH